MDLPAWVIVMIVMMAASLIGIMVMVHFAMDYDPAWDEEENNERRRSGPMDQ